MPALFTFPNRILFGEGALGELAAELRTLGVHRPLVVTDRGITASGLIESVREKLADATIFDGVHANPTESDVQNGLAQYRDGRCDALIGFGGGSAIDAAKAIRLLAGHGGRLGDYEFTGGGSARITPAMPPMIAIPTTSGTGSEAGRGTLIQEPESGRKIIALSVHLLPSVAICDPDLTLGLPPGLTAGTGMDALTHAIESYLSTTFHPICDGIAREALRHIARGLEAAYLDGADREARSSMMLGSLLAGIAFHKGLGVVHSLSHALGGTGRVHHGTLNAILLPHALRFNREVASPQMADLAASLGLGRSGDAPGHLIALTELLNKRLSLPEQLGALDGLDRDQIGHYADLAMRDHCHRTNPRTCGRHDMIALLEAAW